MIRLERLSIEELAALYDAHEGAFYHYRHAVNEPRAAGDAIADALEAECGRCTQAMSAIVDELARRAPSDEHDVQRAACAETMIRWGLLTGSRDDVERGYSLLTSPTGVLGMGDCNVTRGPSLFVLKARGERGRRASH